MSKDTIIPWLLQLQMSHQRKVEAKSGLSALIASLAPKSLASMPWPPTTDK